jgi:hypothetical protein
MISYRPSEDTEDLTIVHQTMQRVRAEFLEMPGMRLTVEQVQRLCGVEASVCQLVMNSLVARKFLYVHPDGTYVRHADDVR